MDSLFKQISISKLARYAYPGFLVLLIIYMHKIEPISKIITEQNIVLVLCFALTFGTTFYIFYRYIIGEYILYFITNVIHILYRKKTSPIICLKKFTYKKPVTFKSYWIIYWRGRKAYNYLRRFYFSKEEGARLDFYHTEIYLLYVTFVIGLFYWLLIFFIPNDTKLVFDRTLTLLIVGLITLLFWVAAIIIDIQQHEVECRGLEHGTDQKGLEEFLVKYGLSDK